MSECVECVGVRVCCVCARFCEDCGFFVSGLWFDERCFRKSMCICEDDYESTMVRLFHWYDAMTYGLC